MEPVKRLLSRSLLLPPLLPPLQSFPLLSLQSLPLPQLLPLQLLRWQKLPTATQVRNVLDNQIQRQLRWTS
jgi:hypothetical protein